MKTMIVILLTAAITNNYVLVKFLGICSFLGVSRKLDQAVGMSAAVIFVMLMSTAVTWPIYHFLLDGGVNFVYMETVVFILVIAALVQLVEIVLKKYLPALHASLGVYLPLITTNCAVLGVTMNNISDGYTFWESMVCALGCGLAISWPWSSSPASVPVWMNPPPPRPLTACPSPWSLPPSSPCPSSDSPGSSPICSVDRR